MDHFKLLYVHLKFHVDTSVPTQKQNFSLLPIGSKPWVGVKRGWFKLINWRCLGPTKTIWANFEHGGHCRLTPTQGRVSAVRSAPYGGRDIENDPKQVQNDSGFSRLWPRSIRIETLRM